MINILAPFMVMLGAAIMAFSIAKLYLTLKVFRGYTQKVYGNVGILNGVCLIMMIFFLLGYIIYATYLLFASDTEMIEFLVAVIFFLGSIFVYCMVIMQEKMSYTISQRSLETIYSLISAVEAKDEYTKGHSEHVKNIIKIFYKHLPITYQSSINLEMLLDAAMLHDIGKIGIPDSILNKPTQLTPEEYSIIKQHPRRGYDILKQTVYNEIAVWILYHHERVDGRGYYGIGNEEMPLESKIIAIADTFSALHTNRVYRLRFSFEESIKILKECAGTQLDKELVEIFCNIERKYLLMEK